MDLLSIVEWFCVFGIAYYVVSNHGDEYYDPTTSRHSKLTVLIFCIAIICSIQILSFYLAKWVDAPLLLWIMTLWLKHWTAIFIVFMARIFEPHWCFRLLDYLR